MSKKIEEKEKGCYMCGDKKVVYIVGSKQRAFLNGRDYTDMINAYYPKGSYLCGECLFK